MANYLSDSGLSYFWGKCKARFADKHSTQTASLTTSGWSSNEKNRIGDGRDNYEYRISCARARKSSGLDGGRVVMHGARGRHTDI